MYIIGGIAIGAILLFLILFKLMWRVAEPNEALIISGRRHTHATKGIEDSLGFKIITGKGTLVARVRLPVMGICPLVAVLRVLVAIIGWPATFEALIGRGGIGASVAVVTAGNRHDPLLRRTAGHGSLDPGARRPASGAWESIDTDAALRCGLGPGTLLACSASTATPSLR